AGEFLGSDPVRHNLILTLLHGRVAAPEPGRYWVVDADDRACGVVFQSPLQFVATLTPMSSAAASAAADAIADAGVALPGVSAEAATAAHFAGRWTERTQAAALPDLGQRLYAFGEPGEVRQASGVVRRADEHDRGVLIEWTEAFEHEIGEQPSDAAAVVDRRLRSQQLFAWEDGGVVAMAGVSAPVGDVVRVGPVYTPPAARGHGYASALVASLSIDARSRGLRCILFADLANPTANALYRRIGYQAVAEWLRYRFEPAERVTNH
ncbi:MAG TPA: GNAT family N-acetyltransferase, partial [Acidimicrobiia bacterium]|nr:GNAT family N-acetyltransferase [Acidimicrobiia bacterium]